MKSTTKGTSTTGFFPLVSMRDNHMQSNFVKLHGTTKGIIGAEEIINDAVLRGKQSVLTVDKNIIAINANRDPLGYFSSDLTNLE